MEIKINNMYSYYINFKTRKLSVNSSNNSQISTDTI